MFRTEVKIPKSDFLINHKSGILTVGSCFAENIGEKLNNAYFNVEINPFGVQFNPISIVDNLSRLIEGIPFESQHLFQNGELWSSFAHSTLFSRLSAEESLNTINEKLIRGKSQLKEAEILLITFGTAWVYEFIESGKVVNNCHKLPSTDFKRYRLDVETIVRVFSEFLAKLNQFNPKLKIIFSVSPVRHSKDGAHENSLSKSTLHLAVNTIVNENANCTYFPAYEILIDELRDYRFFADDMCHPSDLAIDYIWRKFLETYLDLENLQICKEFEEYRLRTNHRSIHLNSHSDLLFKEKTQEVKKLLGLKYPYLKDRL